MFVALKPDGTPLGLYPDMGAAQTAIAEHEICPLRQGLYQIHPINEPADATRLKVKLIYDLKLEKFDGEGTEGPLLDVIEYHGET